MAIDVCTFCAYDKSMRTGRPKKPIDDKRAVALRIRLTGPEKIFLERAASGRGMTLSSWVREWLRHAATIDGGQIPNGQAGERDGKGDP